MTSKTHTSSGSGSAGKSTAGKSAAKPSSKAAKKGSGKDVTAKARGRSDGFTVGSDRALGSLPNWDSQDSVALYNSVMTDNEPAEVDAVGRAWQDHGKNLHQAADELYDALDALGDIWSGQGAGAAQGALVAIANSSSQAGEAASSMGDRVSHQAQAAAEVKKMPAPKNFDPGRQLTAMLAGGPAAMVADLKTQDDEARSVKAQQVMFLNAYTEAMSEVDNSTPSFAPETFGLGPAVSGPTYTLSGLGFHSIGAVPDALSGVAAPAPAGPVPAEPAGNAAAHAASVTAGHSASAGGSGGAGLGVAAAVGAGVVAGGLGVVGARKLLAGKRSGSRAATRGRDGETEEQTATANGQRGAAGAAPGTGVVTPSGTIDPAAAQGAGFMPMGGAGAPREGSTEHSRASYLIQPDPEGTFGGGAATPPPVIGADDWQPEDQR